MAESSKSVDLKKKKTGWRAGIGTLLSVLIVVFGAYYFIRVQQKTAYFGQRNLRILATIARQLDEVVRPPAPTVDGREGALVWRPAEGDFERTTWKSCIVDLGRPGAITDHVTVEELLEPVLRQSFVEVFDTLIVADEAGVVQWQYPAGTTAIAAMPEFDELRGVGKDNGTIKPAALHDRAFNTRISFEGREFRLFSHPVPLEHADRAAGAKPKPWIVAGLVSRSRFAAATGAVSYTLLICVLAAFLLVIFSLPFLKLGLLGELQRVRVGDILMLGIALLCAIAVITLILLDGVAYRNLREKSDTQLRDLASDIKRHMRDEVQLASKVLAGLDAALTSKDSFSAQIPADVRQQDFATAYPYFESFARIDANGDQRQKWTRQDKPITLIGVADRDYFRDARDGKGWGSAANGNPYVLQAIRSWTTGETQAVIAQRVANPRPEHVVSALAFPMKSLMDTVVAGGCQFVVIDDGGKVVFHSEPQRNGVENFFVETDRDKTLRAAVAGRQNEMLSIRYWGEDQRAFTTPIRDTPWTLVTFRSKRLLRTLNVETIMIAVMFLLLHALGYAIFAALVAVVRPSYRAPWLWPDHTRGDDYIALIKTYALLSIAFAASIYLFRPRVVLIAAAVIPALTLLLTYARLRRVRGGASYAAAAGIAAAVLVLLACVIGGQHETDIVAPHLLVRAVIAAAVAGAVFYAWRSGRAANEKVSVMPGYSYVIAATGLLIISAVLPTTAMYKAAYKIEIESYVKHGQLRLVQELEPRIGGETPLSRLGIYYRFFFDTELFQAGNTPAVAPPHERNPVPRFVEWLLPQYSDHSIRMRELLHSQSADQQWTWTREGDQLEFHSRSIRNLNLLTLSEIPQLLPQWFGRTKRARPDGLRNLVDRDEPAREDVQWDDDAITFASRSFLTIAGLLAYIAFILSASLFLARKVFLVDVRDPLWLDPQRLIGPALGGNMLIFTGDAKKTIESSIERRNGFVELSLAKFDENAWESELTRIDREPSGKGVLIPDFGSGSELKLRLLETLTAQRTRNVVAITTVSPWAIVDGAAKQPELAERWRAIFSTFNIRVIAPETPPVDEDRRVDAPAARKIEPPSNNAVVPFWKSIAVRRVTNGTTEHAKELIERETAHGGPYLLQLREELEPYEVRGREEIYDEIGERAASYYASLWASSTNEEKAVLLHLASDGFANSKDRKTLRRLLSRGLVRRAPNLEIMNETFRRFVISDAHRREVHAYKQSEVPESAWDKIQKPLMFGLLFGGGFIFFTQRELFDASFAMVSGIAGGVPAVLKLVGIFTAPREALASAK